MAGDYTRFRYDPLRDSAGVLMQQGRVLVDQDWNEQTLLEDRRWRTETVDVIGRAVVPIETPNGFEIQISGTNLTIGRGRMYVDGLMAENHGAGPLEFDPILGEVRGTQPVPYDQQPYYPNPPALPTDTNPHLVYLDVFERELTYLENPGLIDKAIGVDTSTVLQTVWQVKVLTDTPAGTDCSTPSSSLAATAPSAGRLTTAAAGVPSSTDPCIVPANGGYRGSGNRLYRVEIHTGGAVGTAQFKWSRDNASVASVVTAINTARDTLTVVMTKRDSVLRFQPNDWVEVTDDNLFFQGLSGEMAQVLAVNDVSLTLQLTHPLAGSFDPANAARHTRVIRWDQSGIVRDSGGNVIVDVDANSGLIPVPAAGVSVVLEDGIQVSFSIDASMPVPQFRALEYWSFAARSIDASIDILTVAPPRGILHHYAWLGFVTFPSGITDCRVFWPPSMGESCDCTVCVSAISHNNGTLTIQTAVNQVRAQGGGKICLGPGVYNINATIAVAGASAIEIAGHGLPTLQATTKLQNQPIMLIERSIDIDVHDVRFAAGLVAASGAGPSVVSGILLRNTFFVRIHHCAFVFGTDGSLIPDGRTLLPAIALSNAATDTDIQWNFFNNVQVAIGDLPNDTGNRLLHALSIEANQMVCAQAGVDLVASVNGAFSQVRIARNFAQSPIGFQLEGTGLDVTVADNSISLAPAKSGQAIACNLSQLQIRNNRISADGKSPESNGVLLGSGGAVMLGVQVTGNQIMNLTGTGIAVAEGTTLVQTSISGNQCFIIGHGGIIMRSSKAGSAAAIGLDVLDNSMLVVAGILDTTSGIPFLVGLQIVSAINVSLRGNTVESVGVANTSSAPRLGILANLTSGLSVSGNRVLDVGPTTPVSVSAGMFLANGKSSVDVSDNEVRRSTAPPANGDASQWTALLITATDHVAVRGNLLESFGSVSTARVVTRSSLLFNENRCLFDNPSPSPQPIVSLAGSPIIASSNYVKGPRTDQVEMLIQSDIYSAVGNIVTGVISANGTILLGALQVPATSQTLNVKV